MKTLKRMTLIISLSIVFSANSVIASNSYQQNLLLNPGDSQLKAEGNGRVMIYDQLKNELVEQALNQQFDRIENMMFVRTQHVQEDGHIESDDDCD